MLNPSKFALKMPGHRRETCKNDENLVKIARLSSSLRAAMPSPDPLDDLQLDATDVLLLDALKR